MSLPVTACSLINQQCWIARIFSQNVLYEVLRWYLKFDYNSLLYFRVTHHWIPSVSHRECTRGDNFCPLVHSLWEIDRIRWLTTPVPNKLLWSNLRYHLSTSYSTFWEKIRAIQHCWLISEQEVTSVENGLLTFKTETLKSQLLATQDVWGPIIPVDVPHYAHIMLNTYTCWLCYLHNWHTPACFDRPWAWISVAHGHPKNEGKDWKGMCFSGERGRN